MSLISEPLSAGFVPSNGDSFSLAPLTEATQSVNSKKDTEDGEIEDEDVHASVVSIVEVDRKHKLQSSLNLAENSNKRTPSDEENSDEFEEELEQIMSVNKNETTSQSAKKPKLIGKQQKEKEAVNAHGKPSEYEKSNDKLYELASKKSIYDPGYDLSSKDSINFNHHHLNQIQANHLSVNSFNPNPLGDPGSSTSVSGDQIQYVDGRPRLIVSIELDLLKLMNINQFGHTNGLDSIIHRNNSIASSNEYLLQQQQQKMDDFKKSDALKEQSYVKTDEEKKLEINQISKQPQLAKSQIDKEKSNYLFFIAVKKFKMPFYAYFIDYNTGLSGIIYAFLN